ncbi:hypothetical protein [Bremerella cremea]|uniref:hypothetical protein n=1 Tax=Bremerella cremea TaxID=1031537 RepID=UPI0031EE7161
MARLDTEQICGWRDFYLRNPFGMFREDLRNMVLIHYILGAQGGMSGDPPNPLFPYLDSLDELQQLAEEFFALD